VVDEIGAGRLGPVFRAHDATTDRFVAVKLFTIALARDGVRRLLDEFEQIIAADLSHPSIVKPLAAGPWGSSVYLVQEHVSGESLDLLWRKAAASPLVDALGSATEIAGALDSAAVARVRHGLLAPHDVLIHGNDTRVIGFGVAQALEAGGAEIPRPWLDRAPGRMRAEGYGRQADIAALAAIVERLLAPSTERTAQPDVRQVLDRAGDPSQGRPFTSALEFVAALMSALGFESASPPQVGLTPIEPTQNDSIAPTFSTSARTTRAARPAMWAMVAAALAGLAIAGTTQYRTRDSQSRAGEPVSMARRVTPSPVGASEGRRPIDPGNRTPVSSSNGSTAVASRATASDSRSRARPALEAARAGESQPAAPSGSSKDDDATGSMLFVDSQPRGATLYVDDKVVGTTPLAIPAVPAGEHALRLESEGRPAWSSPVRVRANHLNRIMVTFDR
jgi:serine/threonine protein kinase